MYSTTTKHSQLPVKDLFLCASMYVIATTFLFIPKFIRGGKSNDFYRFKIDFIENLCYFPALLYLI